MGSPYHDQFDDLRLTRFRRSLAWGFVVASLGLIAVALTDDDSRSILPPLPAALVVAASLAAFSLLGLWQFRSPLSRGPARAGFALVFVSLCAWQFRGNPTRIEIVLRLAASSVLAVGFVLLWRSLSRRRGGQLRCAACRYEKDGSFTDRCPECGTFWNRAGATIRGRRAVFTRPLLAGLTLFAAGSGTMWFASLGHATIIHATPTWILFHYARHVGFDECKIVAAELDGRGIPSAAAERAANVMLDQRRRAHDDPHVRDPMIDWVVNQWLMGSKDPAFIERLALETAPISLRLGSRPSVGSPTTLQVGCDPLPNGDRCRVWVLVESLALDDGTDLVQRGRTPINRLLYPNLIDDPVYDGESVRGSFTPTSPGPRRAILAYWLLVAEHHSTPFCAAGPYRSPPAIIRSGDAAFAIHDSHVYWSKRYVAALDFTVAP